MTTMPRCRSGETRTGLRPLRERHELVGKKRLLELPFHRVDRARVDRARVDRASLGRP